MNYEEILNDVLPVLKEVAPNLVAVLVSPTGSLITTIAIHLLGMAFGFDPATELNKINEMIANDDNKSTKLFSIEAMINHLISMEWVTPTKSTS